MFKKKKDRERVRRCKREKIKNKYIQACLPKLEVSRMEALRETHFLQLRFQLQICIPSLVIKTEYFIKQGE